MKRMILSLLAAILTLLSAACAGAESQSINRVSAAQPAANSATASGIAPATLAVKYDSDDMNHGWSISGISYITFRGDAINVAGGGTVVDGNKVAIISDGTYLISGKLDDGQVIVRCEDQGTVKLVFYGLDITCSTSAPIYIFKAKKTVITLADGTANRVTDGKNYVFADSTSDEPNAAIFSKADLTINGSGSLTVNANFYNGIQSKDDLKITGGEIVINAVNDGLKGRDSVALKNASLTVKAGGDGMQSTNGEDQEKGYIAIESGTLNITAAMDGIAAETRAIISGGDISISSGGGSANGKNRTSNMGPLWSSRTATNTATMTASENSTKGIKAADMVTINGGSINIDSADDSLHSNGGITINGGAIVIVSGDDGMHADSAITINRGDIDITRCYEGLESMAVTINSGNIHIISSDDGINVVGGEEVSPMMGPPGQMGSPPAGGLPQMGNPPAEGTQRPMGNPGTAGQSAQLDQNTPPPVNVRPGQDQVAVSTSSSSKLDINGGYLVINSGGDGLDIGGTINMTGGTVIVNGPTANDNGAIDHAGFIMTGGFLVAVGSSGMAQAPGTTSTQYAVMLNLTSVQPAGTMLHLKTGDGKELLTFMPAKQYQSMVFSTPEVKSGSTCIVYTGGSSAGAAKDGLYTDGTYTPGKQVISFTISSILTTSGSSMGGFPSGGRR